MKIKDLYNEIIDFAQKGENIYIWGAGQYGAVVCSFLKSRDIDVNGFIESIKKKDQVNGIRVFEYEEWLKVADEQDVVIIAMGEKNQNEIRPLIINLPCSYLIIDTWKMPELKKYKLYSECWGSVKNNDINENRIKENIEIYKQEQKERIEWLKPYQDRWKFPDWHMNPINDYAYEIVNYISTQIKDNGIVPFIVEVGCGLCNIIGNEKLNTYKRLAIDMRESIIGADKEIWKNGIEFQIGSFNELVDLDIDFLISVNFLHGISPDELSNTYARLFNKNHIKYYIVDEVTGNYTYLHKFTELLPKQYHLIDSLGPFEADDGVRFVRVFKIINE